MADRCSFYGSTAGPFNKVGGLFTVLMCADCQAGRGHGSGSYPVMTRAQMRARLELLPTWALEQKAAAFSVPACKRTDLLARTTRISAVGEAGPGDGLRSGAACSVSATGPAMVVWPA